MHMPRIPLACITLILLWAWWPPAVFAQANNDIQVLNQFQRLYIDNQTTPPPLNENWQPVELKDVWDLSHRIQHLEAWYRTEFTINENNSELALFIPRISANASFWLNGVEIGNTGSFNEPLARNWNYPVLLDISQQQLKAGTNELAVRLKVNPVRQGYLFEMYLGPRYAVTTRYDQSYFLKITAAKILSVSMALSAVLVLIFYFATSLPKSYFWFALGTGFWSIFSLAFFIRNPPPVFIHWEEFISIALLAAVICYYTCVNYVLNRRRFVIQNVLWGLLAIQTILYAVLPFYIENIARAGFTVFAVGFMALIGLNVIITAAIKPIQHRIWLILIGVSVVFIVVYDVITANFQITQTFAKFPYIPLVAIIGGASIFVHRLILREREHESLKDRQKEIEAAARNEALRTERQRLMQEIHDGVGGQLVSTLARLEKNRTVDTGVMQTLRTSIDDLRIIVHSLDTLTQYGDVITLLATIRERMEKNLRQQGIQIDWQVQPVPPIEDFSSEHALQLLRIVQEAITNTIKHANATLISLRCYPENKNGKDGIVIQIHDNGEGFESDAKSVGLGLKNMRDRAAKLQGVLSVQSDGSGTSIEVWVPLQAAIIGEPTV